MTASVAKPSIKEQNLIEIITIFNAVCFRVSAQLWLYMTCVIKWTDEVHFYNVNMLFFM